MIEPRKVSIPALVTRITFACWQSQPRPPYYVGPSKKVEPDAARPTYICTEPGIGYRFRAESENG